MQRLPPIEDWWATLTEEQKEVIARDPRAPLKPDVIEHARGEPEDLDHAVIEGGYDVIRLSPSERTYVNSHSPHHGRNKRMANSPNATSDRH